MTDDTVKSTADPLQSDAVVQEAGKEVSEGEALECLTTAFERYVKNYQDTWQKEWLNSIQVFEQEVENWQNSIATVQTKTPSPVAPVAPVPPVPPVAPVPPSPPVDIAAPTPMAAPKPAPKKNSPPNPEA